MIAGGRLHASDNGINFEIIDVIDYNFSCINSEQLPVELFGASGVLMNGQTPFICGGVHYGGVGKGYKTYFKDCYQLTEAGSWAKDQIASLFTERAYAGYGKMALDNTLVITGGFTKEGSLSSIEVLSPNAIGQTLSIQLPTAIYGHCQVPWDPETFLVIGGFGTSNRNETHFINVKKDQLTNGPSLNTGRSRHACAELQFNGKSYIVVSGGQNYDGELRSTEVLDKDNVVQGWQKSKNLN